MKCKLYNDDCLNILTCIEDETIDLIITSPPYNLGHSKRYDYEKKTGVLVQYNNYSDNLRYEEYKNWLIKILNELYRVLKPTGLLYFNHKERHFKGHYFNPLNIIQSTPFKPLQTIIWKRGGVTFNIGRFVNSYETINVAYKTVGYMRIDKDYEKYFDVWDIPPDKNKFRVASFPLELPKRIIGAYSYHSDLKILDPFMGTGTTAVASQEYGYDFIGVEIDKETYDYAVNRTRTYQTRLI